MEKSSTLEDCEKIIDMLRDRWWPHKAKIERRCDKALSFDVLLRSILGKKRDERPDVGWRWSLSGAGTVLRV